MTVGAKAARLLALAFTGALLLPGSAEAALRHRTPSQDPSVSNADAPEPLFPADTRWTLVALSNPADGHSPNDTLDTRLWGAERSFLVALHSPPRWSIEGGDLVIRTSATMPRFRRGI